MMLSQDERDLIRFISDNPECPPNDYVGLFHHLGFSWRKFQLSTIELCEAIRDAITGCDTESCRKFFAQYMRVYLSGNSEKMTQLMTAAFG